MKFRILVKSLFLIIGVGSIAFAQTEDVEAIQQQDVEAIQQQSNAIIVTSSADESGALGTTVMSMDASELGGGMFFEPMMAGRTMGFDVAGSNFSLLNDASVQKDLALVDGQLERIEAINKEFSERMKENLKGIRDEEGNIKLNSTTGFRDLIAEMKNQQQEEINSILLPNQQARLKQVARQMKMRRMGSEKALTKLLAEELGLTADQTQRIQEKSKELKKQIEEKIAEMKANAKKELFSELTKEQKQKLEELLGDDFQVKQEDTKSRFRRMMMRQQSTTGDF